MEDVSDQERTGLQARVQAGREAQARLVRSNTRLVGQPYYALATMPLHAFVTVIVYAVRAAYHLHAADLGLR